jgi:hypothetical protein
LNDDLKSAVPIEVSYAWWGEERMIGGFGPAGKRRAISIHYMEMAREGVDRLWNAVAVDVSEQWLLSNILTRSILVTAKRRGVITEHHRIEVEFL